jgi:hypothetical protein
MRVIAHWGACKAHAPVSHGRTGYRCTGGRAVQPKIEVAARHPKNPPLVRLVYFSLAVRAVSRNCSAQRPVSEIHGGPERT